MPRAGAAADTESPVAATPIFQASVGGCPGTTSVQAGGTPQTVRGRQLASRRQLEHTTPPLTERKQRHAVR